MEQYEEAIWLYKKCLKIEPDDMVVNIALGIILTKLGRIEEAI